jgi:hypothetical protein
MNPKLMSEIPIESPWSKYSSLIPGKPARKITKAQAATAMNL